MIIVTGGTHGIGRATVEILAKAGARVLFAGRDARAGEGLLQGHDNIRYIQADVGQEADCRKIVDLALELGAGEIKGLVNNAGVGRRKPFAETTLEDWDEILRINARSTFLLSKLALDGLIKARGSVVNVASIAGMLGEEDLAAYVASKAAVIGLTQSLCLELGHLVRFNAVCPGQIATRMMAKIVNDADRRRSYEVRIPAGRFATPEEVGQLIAWLLSDQSSYVNGAVIPVDGGESSGFRTPRSWGQG